MPATRTDEEIVREYQQGDIDACGAILRYNDEKGYVEVRILLDLPDDAHPGTLDGWREIIHIDVDAPVSYGSWLHTARVMGE